MTDEDYLRMLASTLGNIDARRLNAIANKLKHHRIEAATAFKEGVASVRREASASDAKDHCRTLGISE